MKAQLIQLGQAFDSVLTPKQRAGVLMVLQEMEQHGTNLQSVWDFYKKYNQAKVASLEDAFKQFLVYKKQKGLRETSLQDYRKLQELFERVGPSTPVGLVTLKQLESWTDTKPKGSVLKYKNLASGFFSWCKKRGYCTENIASGIDTPRYEPKTPTAIPTEDLRKVLAYAKEHTLMYPYLVIALYGGLRREEIRRLKWSDFDFDTGRIILDSKQTKTRKRRVVTLLGNAAEALKPYTRCLIDPKNSGQKLTRLKKACGLDWGRDAMRHTSAAHMLNIYKSFEETAMQLGNSPGVIRDHYLAVATPEETQTFLSLV